jgi:cbb3-type cytochrome oxidase subunit 1
MAWARQSRRAWRQIWRYWGLILVVVMVVSLDRHLGVLPYAVMTMLVVICSLFAAPTWCGAVNRRRGRENPVLPQ